MSGARDSRRRCSTRPFDVLEQRLIKDRHLKLLLELDGRRFNAIFFGRVEPLPREAQTGPSGRRSTSTRASADWR